MRGAHKCGPFWEVKTTTDSDYYSQYTAEQRRCVVWLPCHASGGTGQPTLWPTNSCVQSLRAHCASGASASIHKAKGRKWKTSEWCCLPSSPPASASPAFPPLPQPVPRTSSHTVMRARTHRHCVRRSAVCARATGLGPHQYAVGLSLWQRKGFAPLQCAKARVMPPLIVPMQRHACPAGQHGLLV